MPYISRTPKPPYYAVVFTSNYMIRISRVEREYGRPD
jgi:hypothetical protein